MSAGHIGEALIVYLRIQEKLQVCLYLGGIKIGLVIFFIIYYNIIWAWQRHQGSFIALEFLPENKSVPYTFSIYGDPL